MHKRTLLIGLFICAPFVGILVGQALWGPPPLPSALVDLGRAPQSESADALGTRRDASQRSDVHGETMGGEDKASTAQHFTTTQAIALCASAGSPEAVAFTITLRWSQPGDVDLEIHEPSLQVVSPGHPHGRVGFLEAAHGDTSREERYTVTCDALKTGRYFVNTRNHGKTAQKTTVRVATPLMDNIMTVAWQLDPKLTANACAYMGVVVFPDRRETTTLKLAGRFYHLPSSGPFIHH